MAVLAEKPEELACYRADAREPLFSDILEMTYTNGICLNGIRMEGNIMHMSVRTWWVNHYEEHGKVKRAVTALMLHFAEMWKNRKHLDFPSHPFPVRVVAAALTRYGRKNVLIVAVNIIWKRKAGSSSRCI